MQLDRKPQPDQIWQHYKGNDYRTQLITGIDATTKDLYSFVDKTITHSELSQEVVLCDYRGKLALTTDLGEDYVSRDQIITEPHVIYQRVNPEFPQIWARPLDNFLEIISTPYIEGVVSSNYARFTRIK